MSAARHRAPTRARIRGSNDAPARHRARRINEARTASGAFVRTVPSVVGSVAISVAAVGVLATRGETAPGAQAEPTKPAAAHFTAAWASPTDHPSIRAPRPSEGTPDARSEGEATPPSDPSTSAAPRPSRDEPRVRPQPSETRPDVAKRPTRPRPKPPSPPPPLTPADIARAVGTSEPHVAAEWPVIEHALAQEGMTDLRTRIAALATIVTEVGPGMRPINEEGGPSYFTQMYEWRSDLGNSRAGDGARYHGRGYIQLTGRANYRAYGARLGLPLEERPDLALRPDVAARVLAAYFKDRGVDAAARQGRWGEVRLRVNGGYNGWSRYSHVVSTLLGAASR